MNARLKLTTTLVMTAALVLICSAGTWAQQPMSDKEYKQLIKSSEYAAADRKMARVWKSLPSEVKKMELPEQRQWVDYGRERATCVYQKQGFSRDQALAMATRDSIETLLNYAKGRY